MVPLLTCFTQPVHVQVLVSEVTDEGKVYACTVNDGPALEKLMDNLREEFTTTPPVRVIFIQTWIFLLLST